MQINHGEKRPRAVAWINLSSGVCFSPVLPHESHKNERKNYGLLMSLPMLKMKCNQIQWENTDN